MKFIIAALISFATFASAQQGQVRPFLVVYKTENAAILKNLRGLQLQSYLKSLTAKNERLLVQKIPNLSRLSGDQARTLWILNSSILKLNSQQASAIQKLPNVNQVFPISGQVQLIRPVQSQDLVIENTKDFTYGLIKIGIPELRTQFQNLTGEGVRVGIIDSGIDMTHPDLEGKVVLYRNFIDSNQKPSDEIGHGTHVAGTITGGKASGRSIGVAPGAQLVVAKIFSNRGNASIENIMLSLQWMVDPDDNSETDDGVHVVNNSWGSSASFSNRDPQNEPFCAILTRMRAMNVLPVFAAGNSGPRAGSISIPGACPDSLTVGATGTRDQIASFSSKGPATWQTVTLQKPDMSAPGVDTISSVPRGGYSPKSGTSMATPHVTGAIALMKQARPELNHQQLTDLVISTSVDLGAPGIDASYGQGRLDVKKAIQTILKQAR